MEEKQRCGFLPTFVIAAASPNKKPGSSVANEDMDYEVFFDKEQKFSGFNSKGHYQFGYLTCPYCKSDKTEPKEIYEGGKKYSVRVCAACTGLFNVRRY